MDASASDLPLAGKLNICGVEVRLLPAKLPVVYFDNAPTIDQTNGLIGITLTTMHYLPNNAGVTPIAGVAAYLKCGIRAATELRDAIDKALLLVQPVGSNNAN